MKDTRYFEIGTLLRSALREWKDAGGSEDTVVYEIERLIEAATERPTPPDVRWVPRVVSRFERAADSAALLFPAGEPPLRDLPPGAYVVCEADTPNEEKPSSEGVRATDEAPGTDKRGISPGSLGGSPSEGTAPFALPVRVEGGEVGAWVTDAHGSALSRVLPRREADFIAVALNATQGPRPEGREGTCGVCGRDHPSWYADNDLWNPVMREDGRDRHQFICPTCFTVEAIKQGCDPIFRLSRGLPARPEGREPSVDSVAHLIRTRLGLSYKDERVAAVAAKIVQLYRVPARLSDAELDDLGGPPYEETSE